MQPLKPGDKVKLSPSILEDEKRKQSHFFFKRIIEEDRTGEVVRYENSDKHKGWWVKFHYGKILLNEDQTILITGSL